MQKSCRAIGVRSKFSYGKLYKYKVIYTWVKFSSSEIDSDKNNNVSVINISFDFENFLCTWTAEWWELWDIAVSIALNKRFEI